MTELTFAEIPLWLNCVSVVSLAAALACAAWIAVDVRRRPQRMAVMNVVWPVTALFGSGIWLWLYRRYGRTPAHSESCHDHDSERPAWVSVAIGTSHCGAGCSLGDLIAETALVAAPALAVAVGWRSLYQQRIFAEWIWDLVIAFILGIIFQYFAIAPMRDQPRSWSLRDALKADTFSILAWQLGMYAAMALLQFLVVVPWLGGTLSPTTPTFWLAMQIAMLAGFATSYPVSATLIRRGVKEVM
jgi:hypothetical protein